MVNWKKSSAMKRLRSAIQKVRFLLNVNFTRLRFSTALVRCLSRRRLSFPRPNSPSPTGLMELTLDDHNGIDEYCTVSKIWRSDSTGTTLTDADIDRKAEDFIANFYKHIQMERQVSLELRYAGRQLEKTNSY